MKPNPHRALDIVFGISLGVWTALIIYFGVWMMPG